MVMWLLMMLRHVEVVRPSNPGQRTLHSVAHLLDRVRMRSMQGMFIVRRIHLLLTVLLLDRRRSLCLHVANRGRHLHMGMMMRCVAVHLHWLHRYVLHDMTLRYRSLLHLLLMSTCRRTGKQLTTRHGRDRVH